MTRTITITLSLDQAELLEALITLGVDLGRDLPSIAEGIERIGAWSNQVGDSQFDDVLDFLEQLRDDVLPIRPQDLRLTQLRDRLCAARLPERRTA